MRLPVYLACTLLALVTNYVLGKDMAWDLLNYHLYAGFSAVHDRFSQDYFAAGLQSYINPYAYIPFYLLVQSGLSALGIASILAVAQSAVLWLTFELALRVAPSGDRRTRVTIGLLAVAMAFINPILIQQIGSSFADITTTIPALAGWVLLAGAVRAPGIARFVWAGVLLGAASALKLSNAFPAMAAFVFIAMLPVPLHKRALNALYYGISLGAGFVVTTAPWSYHLWKMFRNPLFPLLNNVFRSPAFTTAPLLHYRFIPGTLGEALWRPFAMIDPMNMVHEELRAPDIRYAVLLALAAAVLVTWLWRRFAHRGTRVPARRSAVAVRTLAALGCAFAADWILWLKDSGNSRYFLPMSCIAAVVIVGLLYLLLEKHPKARNYVLAAVFAVQGVQLGMGTEFRWNAAPWGGKWFQISMPEKLAREPSLYLGMGIQSNSYIAPFLAPGSGLVNFSGGYALGPAGVNGARIEALIRRYAPHLRMLASGRELYADKDYRTPHRSQIDAALSRFGLRVDPGDCETIVVHGLRPPIEPIVVGSVPVKLTRGMTSYLVSCRVVPQHASRASYLARKHRIDLVLDRLEDACPRLFQPPRPLTELSDGVGVRIYLNTDLVAWVSHGRVKFQQAILGDQEIDVGRESDWLDAPLKLACGRRNGHYFAKVLESRGR